MPEPDEITFRHVADELHNGTHVALLVRHAERPPLPANDPTFGRDLPLTERGVADAIRYGRELSLFACGEQMTIAAGGNRRCMETAFHILDGMGLDLEDEQYAVIADPYLGGRTYYFGDVAQRMELANAGNYLESLNAYFRNGRQCGFNELHASTSLLAGRLLYHYDTPLFIGITHDLNIACFLAGNGTVLSFTNESWPGFLDAAVLFIQPDYSTTCHLLRFPTTNS